VAVQVGYRRKLGAWGLDAFARLDLGTESTGIRTNDLGGHVDYTTSAFLGLHFLHYLDAPGITSFYFGGGAAFELAFFEAIRPLKDRAAGERHKWLSAPTMRRQFSLAPLQLMTANFIRRSRKVLTLFPSCRDARVCRTQGVVQLQPRGCPRDAALFRSLGLRTVRSETCLMSKRRRGAE